ncbi:MAG: ChaN family lipoprotein [Candidatus Marinimicrobia bacterium]|nr:ChaN family lipoprotein [Candidatus Neomarinimicrobiota bacterium]
MRIKTMTALMIIFLISRIVAADHIDVDRLPLGDESKRYHYVKAELNKILNTDSNVVVDKESMIDDLASKRIVMVGETHTDQSHHDMQLDIIRGLHERGKKVILALEMFNPAQDSLLAQWTAGKMTEDEWLKADGFFVSWGHNYRYYKEIFDYCRDNDIALKGVNVPSKYASRINRVGIAGLSDEERAAIPDIHLENQEHRFYFASATQGMDATMPSFFPNMYAAQSLWDTAMGEGSIRHALANPDAVVVTLAGSGHVVYNFGIGRIIQDRSELSFASVVAVGVDEEVEEFGMMKVRRHLEKEKADDEAAKHKKAKSGFFKRLFGGKRDKSDAKVAEMPIVEKTKPAMAHAPMKDTPGKKGKMPSGMPGMPPPTSSETATVAKKESGGMPKSQKSAMSMHMGMGMEDSTPYKVVTRSLADYIWGKPLMTQELYPSLGFSAKMQGIDTLLITRVLPETIAWENGLKRGDLILAVDNKCFTNIIDYQIYKTSKNWDDDITFSLIRDGKKKTLRFKIEPLEEDCPCAKD